MARDARIDVEVMDHGNLNLALKRFAAIAAKAHTLAIGRVARGEQNASLITVCKRYLKH